MKTITNRFVIIFTERMFTKPKWVYQMGTRG